MERRMEVGDTCKMDVCTNVHLLKLKARRPVSVPASESDQTGLSRRSCCVSTDALSQLAEAFLQAWNGHWMDKLVQQF